MSAQATSVQALREDTAHKFAQLVRQRLPDSIHSIVLYGSVARGSAGADSDIDVLVLADDPRAAADPLSDMREELYEENDYRGYVSSLTMTPQHLEELRRGGFPIAGHIIEDGIALFDDGTFAQWRELGPMTTPGEEYIKNRLALAAEMMRDAESMLDQEAWRSAIDRGYYAMLHSAEAALAMYGVEPARTHDGLRSQFGERLVKPGILQKRFGTELAEAHGLRLEATYEAEAKLGRDAAETTVAQAERFVERVRGLARERGL